MTGSGPLPVPYWESVYLHNSFSQCPLSPLSVPHEVPVSSKFIRRRIEDLERAEGDPCRFPNRKCYGDFWSMELLAFGKHAEGGGLQGHGTVDKSQETGPVHINLTPAEHPPQLSMDARKDAGLDSCSPPPPRPILCLGVWPCEGCPLSLRASLRCSFLP